jgi:hypothetical protein
MPEPYYSGAVDVTIANARVSNRHVQDRWLFLELTDGAVIHLPLSSLDRSVTVQPAIDHTDIDLGRSEESGNLGRSASDNAERPPYPNRRRTNSAVEQLVVAWTDANGGSLLHRSVLVRDLQALVDETVTAAIEAAYEHGKRSAGER